MSERLASIDLARGVAVVAMIATHAFDGWVGDPARASAAFRFTRFVGVVPLPAFLLLSGVGVALAARRARDADPRMARNRVFEGSLRVVAAGYLVSLVLGILDGARSVETYLRADVLHAIGLSTGFVAALALGAKSAGGGRARVLGVALALVVVSPLLHLAARAAPAQFAPLLGLVFDVPPYTRFPVVPLVGIVAAGFASASLLEDRRSAVVLSCVGVVVAAAASPLADTLVHAWGGRFDRTHPAITLNVLDLTGRGIAVVAMSVACADALPAWLAKPLVLLGRRSLFAYAFHLPFAYGRLARPLTGALDMTEATLAFVGLVGLTLAAAAAAEHVLNARRNGP